MQKRLRMLKLLYVNQYLCQSLELLMHYYAEVTKRCSSFAGNETFIGVLHIQVRGIAELR